jgi:hypothetical protein
MLFQNREALRVNLNLSDTGVSSRLKTKVKAANSGK